MTTVSFERGMIASHRNACCAGARPAVLAQTGDFAVTLGALKIVRLLWDLDHISLELPSVHS